MDSSVRDIMSRRVLFVVVTALFVFASFSAVPPSVLFSSRNDLCPDRSLLSEPDLFWNVGLPGTETAPLSDGRNDEDLPAALRDLCETVCPAGFLSIRARNRQAPANSSVLSKYPGFSSVLVIFAGRRLLFALEDRLPLFFYGVKTIRKLE